MKLERTMTAAEITKELGLKDLTTCVGCGKPCILSDNCGHSLDHNALLEKAAVVLVLGGAALVLPLCQNPECNYQYHRFINEGDTFPTGRCEKCHEEKKWHVKEYTYEFKPALGKVVGIEKAGEKWKITLEVD
jgi:hypothetical protein